MAITLVPSTTTERQSSQVVETLNASGHRQSKPHYAPRWDAPDHGRYVSKAEYWASWYESEPRYEWNNGYLEAKPMPNPVQLRLFQWFLDILRQYVNTYHNADLLFHEIGFSMTVPDPDQPGTLKEVTRKPDVAALRHDNPVAWQDHERSYHGICDLCVESLSDSTPEEVTRDTEIKKSEYEFAGVQEYYILDPSHQHLHFYQRTPTGEYAEIQPDAQGVIRSQVLPGFQFRLSDLCRQPTLEELALDEVYKGYVLLRYQAAAARAERESQRAERYAAMLREMGINVDDE
jgi:hypothetical protein